MSRRALNPKQHNIATGPQGQRWDDSMIKHDMRWADQSERSLGRAYLNDVDALNRGESTHYYPGQGGPGTQVQGKLFHDPKPIDPHRWPRGFTPERQSDVQATFQPFSGGYGLSGIDKQITRQASEAIARSSMPEKDLSRISKGYDRPIEITEESASSRWAGTYKSDRSRSAGPPVITLGREASAHTVLHEVGHAVSDARRTVGMVGDERLTPDWRTATTTGGTTFGKVAGAEEARADIYGNTHAKKRSGEAHLDTDDYRAGAYSYGYDRGQAEAAFEVEYANEHLRQGKERPSEIGKRLEQEKRAASLKEAMGSPKPSPHLFQRPKKASIGIEGMDNFIPMPTEPDYGQYGAMTPEGKDVGTIPVSGGLPEPIRQSVVRRERMIKRVRGRLD